MTIYIYGSDSFKNEINEVLKHSNIKFRLDDKGEVKELKTLNELKDAIEENPNNIYLIDDSKIIKKNIFTEKIKFLKPKDGIEQEYLLDHGIGDVSVDSIDELSKHIIRRLDAVVEKEDDIEDIQDSIIEIVEGAYEEDSSKKEDEKDEDYIELDDELSALLSSSKEEKDFFEDENEEEQSDEEALADILSQVEEIEVPTVEVSDETQKEKNEEDEDFNFDPSSNLDDLLVQLEESHNEQLSNSDEDDIQTQKNDDLSELDDVLNQIQESEISNSQELDPLDMSSQGDMDALADLSFDDNLDNIKEDEKSVETEPQEIKIDSNTQGEKMSDQFSEFDTLSENDILAALNGIENVTVTSDNENKSLKTETKSSNEGSSSLDLQSSSSDDIAKLITQLLNNKTLEITIKVKE